MNNDNGEQMDDDILPEAEQLSGKMRNSTADKNKVNYEVNTLDVVKVCRFFLSISRAYFVSFDSLTMFVTF